MGVAKRDGHRPVDTRMGCDILVAVPGDIVSRVANSKHRVEQQLHGAAACADDEICARDGIGKRLARVAAQLFHAE